MVEFHQFVQSAFYALARGLAIESVLSGLVWGVAFGMSIVGGALAHRLAQAYEAILLGGAPVDVTTFLSALHAAWSSRGWGRQGAAGGTLMLGVICLGVWMQGSAAGGLAAGLACLLLLCLACIDIHTRLLPDVLTLPLLVLGVWIGPEPIGEALWAASLTYLCTWGLAGLYGRLRGQVGMGGGDFKLMAALAAWTGGQALTWIVLGACVGGLVFAMGAQRRLVPCGAYPFGPFLALAAAPVLVAGARVQSWF